MKYTITIYLNNIDKDVRPDFELARQFYAEHGIDVSFEFQNVSVSGYTSQWTGTRWFITNNQLMVPIVKTDAAMFVFNQNEWATPKGSQFPLRQDTPAGNCYMWAGKPFINVGYYEVSQTNKSFYLEIVHEMMHSLVQMANWKGFNIPDVMDTYFKNNISQYKDTDSNFSNQFRLLEPFLHTTMKPTVTITRRYTDKETFGDVVASNGGATFTCKSLELPWLNNQRNISCIPAGTYELKFTRSFKYPLGTYEVQKVPNRSGIRIHIGNYATGKKVDIEGCILLGNAFNDINKDTYLDITNSTITVNAFVGFLGKKDATLIIK